MTAWTPPSDIVPGANGDISQYNAEAIDNLKHLKELQDTRGVIAEEIWEDNDSARTIASNTDMVLTANVVAGRAYRIHAQYKALLGPGGFYFTHLTVNGSHLGRLGFHDRVNTYVAGATLYQPSSTALVTIRVRLGVYSAGGNLTLQGAVTAPRRLYVVDLGLQP